MSMASTSTSKFALNSLSSLLKRNTGALNNCSRLNLRPNAKTRAFLNSPRPLVGPTKPRKSTFQVDFNYRSYYTSLKIQSQPAFTLPEIEDSKKLILEKKYAKAEPLLRRSLEIAKYAVGETSAEFAKLNESLAECTYALHKYQETAALLKSILPFHLQEPEKLILLLKRLTFSMLKSQLSKAETSSLTTILKSLLEKLISQKSSEAALETSIALIKLESIKLNSMLATGETDASHISAEVESIIELSKAETSSVPSDHLVLVSWNLTIARWLQTLYELNNDQALLSASSTYYTAATRNLAKEASPEAELLQADVQLGLGDLARLQKNWQDADEFYKKAVDLTDHHFDRDSPRVRRVIEREAVVQFHLKRWLHAEGLLRRLLDYYAESQSTEQGVISKAQHECVKCYIEMMESRGRGAEVAKLKQQLETVKLIEPSPTFDPDAFLVA